MGIDDHELTCLTAAALLTPRKDLSLGFSMNLLILEREDSFMLLDKWNGLTTRWMTDPKLWEVPEELKPLFPLSIEFGLVYMHATQVPTDDDLQQYPHVFFTSPDI